MANKDNYYWHPTEEIIANANITQFMEHLGISRYEELIEKADADPGWYFDQVIQYCDIRFYKPYDNILDTSKGIPWARWCVGGTTNMTMNCIDKHRGTSTYEKDFLIWEKETGENGTLTYREFDAEVCRLAAGLKKLGVGKGDVVGIFMPNLPETFAAFFAIAKVGAIIMPLFSGFGPSPLITRIQDGGAKVIITADGTWRRGSPVSMKALLDEVKDDIPTVESVIVVRNLGQNLPTQMTSGRDYWWDALCQDLPIDTPTEEMSAEDPAVLLYTSGTTGKPKGAVWTHAGFVTRMATDMGLCGDFKPEDRFFFMSDMGWMVGAMCAVTPSIHGGSLLVVEGAPDYPETDRLWRVIDQYGVSFLGVSPTLVRGMMRYGDDEVKKYAFEKLRVTMSGGEAWTETPWLWYFKNVGHEKMPIVNMSGGTEIGGSIAIGTVIHPEKPSSFAGPCPGVNADIVDDEGNSLPAGEVGELVLRGPSIGLTKSLWKNDDRYIDAYWSTIPNLWVHGDWVSKDEDGNWYILGRSDDTIKVSGKRTGPSEIESILMETGLIAESAVVGVPDDVKGSVIVCVCVPRPEVEVTPELSEKISAAIVDGMGKSYRPKEIIYVSDLPRTRTMKIMRRVVKAILTGGNPGDLSSLVNPETVEELKAKTA
ncbi:MAG TPA: AMP-dependent synthetase [Gammaproteobacteria bacterium]|nr:AMP-dependent synthetase [Gammaproteobacteria bacterium]